MLAPDLAALAVPVASLTLLPANPRRGDVDAIVRSLARFGQRKPIVAKRDGTVVAGNHTLQAVQHLGWDEIAVVWVDDDEATAQAFALADNRTAELGGYDEAALLELIEQVRDVDPELLGDTGWVPDAVAALEASLAESGSGASRTDPDKVPEPPAEPVTKPGDLWLLGPHRLLCGDSTVPEHVARLFDGAKPDVLLTDPPYCSGGFQEAGKKAGSVGTRGDELVANDTLSTRGYVALMKSALSLAGAGVVYVFTDWRMWVNLFDVCESSGYGVRNMIVWDKGTPGMGRGWRSQHELILCGMRVTQPFDPHKAQGNVVASKRTGNVHHATEKPVDLLVTILEVTDMAKVVYDAFGGSGSTLLAAHHTNRTAWLLELDPRIADVACRRYQEHTGTKPILEATGEPYDFTRETEHAEPAEAG